MKAAPMATEIEYKGTRGRPRLESGEGSAPTVRSLDRALTILACLAESDRLNLTEVAHRTGIPMSTSHRLLMALRQRGMVEWNEATQQWMIGVEAFRIGSSFIRRTKIAEVGRPVMRELMEATGETANIGIADDGDVVFVSQVETHETVRAFFWPGTRGPMHASGIGKALLAELPRQEVERIVRRKGLAAFTARTISSEDALFIELNRIRERGWSIDDEERNLGMRCLAAPVFNQFGEAVAGVSVSGPSARVTMDLDAKFGALVRKAADEITGMTGGMRPKRDG